jgi:nitroimidazol reductase NimA-like FMN-containing flavoprotein (pyridoxamine 5'-phosphate oxidase superfamily)
MTPSTELDTRFSEPGARPTSWQQTLEAIKRAEIFWISTVRPDGRPHVTPLVGVWVDDSFVFCTGSDEQKARNLERNANVAVTTGANSWKDGLDVVVEGSTVRVTGEETLHRIADTYREKYNGEWDFDNDSEVFDPDGNRAHVFRVTPAKVIAFAKSPHGQTTFKPSH